MRKRHTEEQVVRKLREAEALMSVGASVADVCRELEVSEATYHRWRRKYGGVDVEALRRLKALEKENAQLKAIVAEQAVDLRILKEVAKGNF